MTPLDVIALVDDWAGPVAAAGMALAAVGLAGIVIPRRRGAQ